MSPASNPPPPSPTPTRPKQSIPRPPPSPLRPDSPSSLPSTPRRQVSSTSPALNASGTSKSPSTPPPGNKTRARDLLRKHYGLGVGPPPPLPRSDSGGKLNVHDPMDLGMCLCCLFRRETDMCRRLASVRCEDVLRTAHHNVLVT